MRIVFESADYVETLIKKGLLEQAGFFVHMDNMGFGSIEPHMSLVLGQRLWVVEADFEEARQLLGDTTLPEDVPASDEPIDTCPACGSWQVVRHRSMIWFPLFFIVDIMMAPLGGRKRRCQACGERFEGTTPELTLPIKILFTVAVFYLLLLAVLMVT